MTHIKFGIQTAQQHVPYQEMLKLWQHVDRLGYDSAWVFDHFIPIRGDVEGPCLECWTLLSALAVQTARLRVGTLVAGNTYRHPAVLANMAATVDVVTGGRLEFGIGAGWYQKEHEAYGVPFYTTGQRIRMLDEAIQVIKLLWTEHAPTFPGKYYQLKEALAEPKPVQKPRPPIWVGGQGEQLTLRVVARQADGWNTFLMPWTEYRRKLDALERHCLTERRDPATVERSLAGALVIGDPKVLAGRADAIARNRGFPPDQLRERMFYGSPQEVAEQINTWAERGVSHFLFSTGAPYDYDAFSLFAQEVIPLFRK